jgi:uracil-DNA glycosylase family 4
MREPSVDSATSAALRAALDWWRVAGVDVLVADAPTPWMGREIAPAPQPGRAHAPVAARVSVPAAPSGAALRAVAPIAEVDSVAAWRAALAERHPDAIALDGAADSGLLLLGDAPALADVEAGRPFAGEAGLLLDRMLKAIGRDRGAAALANLSFWPSHVADGPLLARPWIERLVALMAPRAVVTLGASAAGALLGTGVALPRARGQWHDVRIGGATVVLLPSFHPADLLRAPARKALAWADLLTLSVRMDG